MVVSLSSSYSAKNHEVVNKIKDDEFNLKRLKQIGQIHIYQSSYRGSYSSIIKDSLRNAALGRKVL